MRKLAMYSVLLVAGLVLSQILPGLLGPAEPAYGLIVRLLTMVGLAFIMIHVGYEFELDKSNLRQYGWDYVVAATAAGFPWIFCALYFLAVFAPPGAWTSWDAWKESLLSSRFAAPTSAGVLFSMLAAAGLSATWVFRKARILAIFDDLDTVLLMIPLKMMMVGAAWQLGFVVVIIALLLWLAWRYLHVWCIPITWPWVLGYSVALVAVSEVIYQASKVLDDVVPIHIEVLLPAFVLGCMMARPGGQDPHRDDAREGHQEGPEDPAEQRVAGIVSGAFMLLVGLSMPPGLLAAPAAADGAAGHQAPGWGWLAMHVLLVTVVSNVGKMFPTFCYRREAHVRERLAVSIGMWPRGEVGAGVLVISLSYGISGPMVTVAMLSLALNLVCTGLFILMVRKLLDGLPGRGLRPAGT